MKVLYISSLISDPLFDNFINRKLTSGYTGQKYHGLFANGLAKNLNHGDVTVLSSPPIKKFFFQLKENFEGIKYRYVPIIPILGVKQLVYFIYTFFYSLYWCIINWREEKVIFSSLMRIYQYPSIWLGTCLFGCKQITVACDIPWMTTVQVSKNKLSIKQKLAIWIGRKLSKSFDGYVLLTETMNKVLNSKNRPYIVVEGFCDYQMSNVANNLFDKYEKRVIIYAGGLNAKYGIENLVEAVKSLPNKDVELWLYGSGDMNKRLENESDSRIHFYGPKSNNEVVASELKASILINPRPTDDEYTHFSFPSKTLEYMVSGTYMMTTKLAGIPEEYFEYCGLIDDFSIEGIAKALESTLKMSPKDLHDKGMRAKSFVLNNKNNIIQTKRVIDFAHAIR